VEKVQEHINEEVHEDIAKLYDHAKIANDEMGVIKIDVGMLKNDVAWIKEFLKNLDSRLWFILTVVVIGTLTQIALSVAK
jgi:hypothetical protein